MKKLLILLTTITFCFGAVSPQVIAAKVTPEQIQSINKEWAKSVHALNDINCSSCHLNEDTKDFIAKPTHESCRSCHESQVETFLLGKHGIRLNEGLSPLTPKMAALPMKKSAFDKQMNCNTCHDAHSVNTFKAATDSCLTCHNDSHSLNYKKSKHFELVTSEGILPRPSNDSVTCATCHLPREKHGETIYVNHNNTYNLLPRDRMVKDVCINCHGMEYAYNSIFDDELVTENFARPPTLKLETFDLIRAFEKKRSSQSKGG